MLKTHVYKSEVSPDTYLCMRSFSAIGSKGSSFDDAFGASTALPFFSTAFAAAFFGAFSVAGFTTGVYTQ